MNMKIRRALGAAIVIAAGVCGGVCTAGEPEPTSAKTETAKPKPPPRKKPEYKVFAEAAAVAKAREEPIVVFLELGGDKNSSELKNAIFSRQDFFKDLYADNFVYYHLGVPQVKSKNTGRGQQKKSGRPDFSRLPEAEKSALLRVTAGTSAMPIIALVDSAGTVISSSLVSAGDETPLKTFTNELAEGMKKGKFKDFKLGSKVEKAIKKEAKDAEFKAKMAAAAAGKDK